LRTTWIFVGLTGAFTAAAGASHYGHAASGLTFALSTVALAGLAWIVSFSTEQVGERFGPGVTGVMQSTLGNLPEFFVVVFALSQGELVVAQTSIIGSVFANALLVLGLVIIAGCSKSSDGLMRFSVRLPKDNAILLMLASFLIVILGISSATGDRASHHVEAISIAGAVALLLTYLVWIVAYLRSDTPGEPSHAEPALPLTPALVLLAFAGVGAAFVSDWFVTALSPTMDKLGIPKAFAGLVIVAIAGNAVENFTGLVLAHKGQSDLAVSVVKNSVSQVAAFLFPVLVLISLFFKHTLTFAMAPVYAAALALTALSVWQITGDGEAAEFEGWALVAIYVVLAAVTLYE
jgi:Ca2+:H+ antiporter